MHGYLEIWNYSFCFNAVFPSFAALTREISSWTLEEKLHFPVCICVLCLWLKRKHNRRVFFSKRFDEPPALCFVFKRRRLYSKARRKIFLKSFKPSLSRTLLIDILLLPLGLIAITAQRELVYTWQIKNWSCLPFSARKQYCWCLERNYYAKILFCFVILSACVECTKHC